MTITTSLDPNSAVAIERVKRGEGRFACVDSLQGRAWLDVETSDGQLLGTFEGTIEAFADAIDNVVEGSTANSGSGLVLRVQWVDDEHATLRGWLTRGDRAIATLEGSKG